MTSLTKMVNTSGGRFMRSSVQRARNSSLWFFFITMALRKGDMSRMVSTAHSADAQGCAIILRTNGRKKVNMMATADIDSTV